MFGLRNQKVLKGFDFFSFGFFLYNCPDKDTERQLGIIYKNDGFFQRIFSSFSLVGAIVEAKNIEFKTFSK